MKTLQRYLCIGCVKNMEQARLAFMKVPGSDAEKKACSWCGRKCYVADYLIMYGRGKTNAESKVVQPEAEAETV